MSVLAAFAVFLIVTVGLSILLFGIWVIAQLTVDDRLERMERQDDDLERVWRMPSLSDEERALWTLYRRFGDPR